MSDGSVHHVAGSIEQLRHLRGSSATITKALNAHGLTHAEFKHLINTPVEHLTEAQARLLYDVRHAIPTPKTGTLMQKILSSDTAQKLLGHADGYDPSRIGGFVAKAGDARMLDTPHKIFDGLRLDYKGTEFAPGKEMYAVRYHAGPGNHLDVPDGRVGARIGEKGIDTGQKAPYTGNGFTASSEHVMPEYLASGQLRQGAEMWRITPDGREELVGVLRTDKNETLTWMGTK